jgi:hypothetical protein
VGEVVDHRRVVVCEGPRLEVHLVAGRRDRQCHQPRALVGKGVQDGGAVVGGEQVPGDDPDDLRLVTTTASRHDRVKAVLGVERLFHVAPVESDPGHSPAVVEAPSGEGLEVHRLVGAVEGADADVHDAAGQRRAVVRRDRNTGGMVREGALVEGG